MGLLRRDASEKSTRVPRSNAAALASVNRETSAMGTTSAGREVESAQPDAMRRQVVPSQVGIAEKLRYRQRGGDQEKTASQLVLPRSDRRRRAGRRAARRAGAPQAAEDGFARFARGSSSSSDERATRAVEAAVQSATWKTVRDTDATRDNSFVDAA